MNQANEFSTRDLYVASTLKQSGIPLLRVESNSGRGVFIFRNSEKIQSLITGYFNGTLKVDPKGLFENWKGLKALVFSSINDVR